ncbi:MAG: domain S-box-containing protein [Daejeonella sp.]|nr:domain S-box-containing protein [Daejeonella sp.]
MTEPSNLDFLNSLIDPESLYENAPCGYFSFASDGTIIKINQTLSNWLGWTKNEVTGGMKMTDLLSVGGKIYYQMFYYPLLVMAGTVNEISFDIFRRDGTSFPALVSSNSVKDKDGNIRAVNAVVTDITDRKKYESELLRAKKLAEAEKNRFEFVSNYIPEMIWMASTDGVIDYVNKRFADHFKIPAGAPVLESVISIIHPDDKPGALRKWAKGIDGGTDFSVQLRLKTPAGLYSWYQIKGVPFIEDGFVSKWLGSCLDINTHVLEIEKKDEFLSVASHELKTPVTSLKAYLQLLGRLKDPQLPPVYQKLFEQSNRSVEKIVSLIDDLLSTSRLKEGQLSLRISEFNISTLLENICNTFRLEGKHTFIIHGNRSLKVRADEHRVDQVVINFINNALKYAPNSPEIILLVEERGDFAKVSISDKGPGILREKIPYLFERYYRADHKGSQYSGLGLGLYICAEIIKRHGGTIGVDSEMDSGSTFWFTLPLA